MIYTDLTRKAMSIAYEAHAGQLDKAGVPYIFHPIHLAEQMEDEDTTVVALLHDVVEDSCFELKDLEVQGLTPKQVKAIECLTHKKGEEYLTYVRRVKGNEIARKVKLADLQHNMDLSRMPNVSVKQAQERIEKKYRPALEILDSD